MPILDILAILQAILGLGILYPLYFSAKFQATIRAVENTNAGAKGHSATTVMKKVKIAIKIYLNIGLFLSEVSKIISNRRLSYVY